MTTQPEINDFDNCIFFFGGEKEVLWLQISVYLNSKEIFQ